MAYKRHGEWYEEREDCEEAVDYCDGLVELWANADPELQEVVTDLRNRIAKLVEEAR